MALDFASALDDLVKNYVGGRGPTSPGATVNAPGSALDPATQARLAAARAADRAAVEAARIAAVGGEAAAAAPAAAPSTPKPGMGARAASVLNPNMGGVAKAGGVLAKGSLALAPVLGAISAAADSKENVQKFAGSMDMNYNSFGGRLGANTLNFLQKTGNAATFGLAGRLGRVLSGGSFFEDEPTPPVATAVPPTAPGVAPAPVVQSGTLTDAVPQAAGGTVFESPEVVQMLRRAVGAPQDFGGYIEGPNGRTDLPSGTMQRFGVRRPNLAENINAARARYWEREDRKTDIQGVEAMARLKSAGKAGAEETIANERIKAAQAYLKQNPNDHGGYVAILSGKDPKETQGTIASPTGSTSIVRRGNTVITQDAQGNTVERPIYRQPSEGEIAAMSANKKDPAYKASFLRNFGPDAYKTHIEKR